MLRASCRRCDALFERLWGLFEETPGSLSRDSGVSSKRLRGLFQKTLGSLQRDSGVSSKRLWVSSKEALGLFKEALESLPRDSEVPSKRLGGPFQETLGSLPRDSRVSFKRLERPATNSREHSDRVSSHWERERWPPFTKRYRVLVLLGLASVLALVLVPDSRRGARAERRERLRSGAAGYDAVSGARGRPRAQLPRAAEPPRRHLGDLPCTIVGQIPQIRREPHCEGPGRAVHRPSGLPRLHRRC